MQGQAFRYKGWLTVLKLLLGLFLILTFASFWTVQKQSSYDKQYITYAAELRVLFERFVRHAGEATNEAKPNAFTYLKYRVNEFSAILEILKRGKMDYQGKMVLPPTPDFIQEKELTELSRLWAIERQNALLILDNQSVLVNLYNTMRNLAANLDKVQEQYTNVLTVLVKRKALTDVDTLEIVDQINDANNISDILQSIISHGIDINKVERDLPKNVASFETGLKAFKSKYGNDPVYPSLLDIEKNFLQVKERATEIVETARTLLKIDQAWDHIYEMIPRFLEATTNLEKAYADAGGHRLLTAKLAFTFSGVTLLILALLLYLMYRENIFNLKTSEKETEKLQADIQHLVNELKDLANGNLAVSASKGEGVTSAIAEAINYTINALRRLVFDINHTSQKVSDSAVAVKRITHDLTKAINEQTQQIMQTGDSVKLIATSIDKVSVTARKSAEVAESSVGIAHEGAMVVSNTIGGMERIREQIRETEKRIQRLSESTQEIGEIVSLIDGISEQTNILSLNAAIQAAMAGDVGMGFAVVADEVQQLAVKTSEAAKDVEGIVKTIRSDTVRATESMERAIHEVNTGTTLAHDAGRALERIESVSKNLSDLIQGISKTAEEQSMMSGKITRMMEVIEAIAKQTASGTDTTAESVATLDALVQQLHESVSEFKLPEASYGR